MNKVLLIGNLTTDPTLKFTAGDGKAVCNFTLAVQRNFKKDETDFIPVVAWGKLAENTANFTVKGSQVAVSGSLRISSYTTKDGEKKYKTEVLADEVKFLGKKDKTDKGFTPEDDNSDIPF
jgi:single-strand DNA-binding protein